jgi:hypothetical protein
MRSRDRLIIDALLPLKAVAHSVIPRTSKICRDAYTRIQATIAQEHWESTKPVLYRFRASLSAIGVTRARQDGSEIVSILWVLKTAAN